MSRNFVWHSLQAAPTFLNACSARAVSGVVSSRGRRRTDSNSFAAAAATARRRRNSSGRCESRRAPQDEAVPSRKIKGGMDAVHDNPRLLAGSVVFGILHANR